MNKQHIDKLLAELALDINEYYILSGASLVIRGINEICSDLDLCMTEDALKKIRTRYNVEHIQGKPDNLFQITDEIETFVEPKEKFSCEIVENYSLEDLERIIEFKSERNLEKDKKDITKINKYLNNLKHEISCGAFVINDGKILMVKHKNGGHWDFPKGHMEANETKEQTAIREVREETGIEIEITSSEEYKITYKPKMNVQKDVIFFDAKKVGGTLKKQETEVSKAEWVKLEEVENKLTFRKNKELFKSFLNQI